jgi:hypothetical protein
MLQAAESARRIMPTRMACCRAVISEAALIIMARLMGE